MRKTVLAASAFAGVLASSHAWSAPPKGCSFLRGSIQYIVYLQFDNTHFSRDVPYVPSDTEQMASWRQGRSLEPSLSVPESGHPTIT